MLQVHLDANGVLVSYDLDVKPSALPDKVRRRPEDIARAPAVLPQGAQPLPGAQPFPTAPRPTLLAPPPLCQLQGAAPPRPASVAALCAMVTAALNEGWLTPAALQDAMHASNVIGDGISGASALERERAITALSSIAEVADRPPTFGMPPQGFPSATLPQGAIGVDHARNAEATPYESEESANARPRNAWSGIEEKTPGGTAAVFF